MKVEKISRTILSYSEVTEAIKRYIVDLTGEPMPNDENTGWSLDFKVVDSDQGPKVDEAIFTLTEGR